MKISVIIPVYNAAKHLNECITSLINQTFSNCEFIFVNDGSKDESQKIITDFQQKDARIKLINQENKGVSVARNKGLETTTGNFIGFIDADDFIKNDYFQKLFDAIQNQNADIIVSNFSVETNGKFTTHNSKFKKDKPYQSNQIKQELLPEFIKGSALNSVCNKLYKAQVVKDIFFPVGVALGEDGIFNMQAFSKANSILFIDYSGYFYKEVIGSATKNTKEKDYFQRAIDGYNFDFSKYFDFPSNEILKWKSVRLIDNVFALIHIYFAKNNGLSVTSKFKKVSQIVQNDTVQKSIKNFDNEIQMGKSKYQKSILKAIKLKAVFLLFLLVKYSQIRNKQ